MIKTLLKRAALGLLALILLLVLTAFVWWRFAGEKFLYGVILPDTALLLDDQEIPVLSADVLRQDLEFLREEMPRLHVANERAFPAGDLAQRIHELNAVADRLTPEQRAVELTGLLASGSTGTGHTMVFPFQPALDWRIYPLSTYWFDDGLFVTAAEPALEHAVGSRVVSLGGISTQEALHRLAPYVASDNQSSLRSNITMLLTMAEPLTALGLASDDGILELEIEGADMLRIEPARLTSLRALRWSRRSFTPVDDAWSPADMRPRDRSFSLTYQPASRTLALRLDAIDGNPDESLRQLAERLDDSAREREIDRFVIDLRANGGGNNQLAAPLLETISDHPVLDRRGVMYVLIGRRTFSAAANFACALERQTRAIFVGESSGFAPNHFGDAMSVLLPGSKIVARVATRRWQEDLPGVERTALEPDLAVPFLSSHHFAGVDPAIEAIANHRPTARTLVDEPLPASLLGSYLLTPHHRVRLYESDGNARLAIDSLGRYAITDLHPTGGGSFETDIRGMTLVAPVDRAPSVFWHGATFPLQSMQEGAPLPFELLAAGDVEAAGEAFARTEFAAILGAHLELEVNRLAYAALGEKRTDDAIRIFTLNSVLFPESANVWDGLGDGLKAAGRVAAARRAYETALARDPVFTAAQRSLEELDG